MALREASAVREAAVTVRLSVSVMAHRSRERYIPELLAALDAPAEVVWDRMNNRWDTGRRAILAHPPDATHAMVIQDDALPCRDLVAAVTRICERFPDVSVSPYVGHEQNRAHQIINAMVARARLPTFLAFEGPWWGVCVVFPVPLISPMLAIADTQDTDAYDKRLSRALIRLGVRCLYTLPSLVDHRTDGPSMISGRSQDGRHAHQFIGSDVSALEVDWAQIPVYDRRIGRGGVPPVTRRRVPRKPREPKPVLRRR